jgi:hypothetical protein
MAFKDVIAALRGARDSRADLDAKLDKARATEAELVAAPPHTDDVLAWFRRGLAVQSDEYKRRLKSWYFSAEAKASHPGTWFEADASVCLLAVPRVSPAHRALAPTTGIGHDTPDASVLALTHFLGAAIEAQLPAMVADFFPEASKGIRAADRAAKLEKVRAEIARLEADLAELDEHLKSARRAVA